MSTKLLTDLLASAAHILEEGEIVLPVFGLVDREGGHHRLLLPLDDEQLSDRDYNLVRAYMMHHGATAYVAMAECELASGDDALIVATVTKAGGVVQIHLIDVVAGRRSIGSGIVIDKPGGNVAAMAELLPAHDVTPDPQAEVDLRELLAGAGIEAARLH